MSKKTEQNLKVEFLYRPGKTLSVEKQKALVRELRDCAATCFDEIPDYQCLRGTKHELDDKAISIAWRPDGKIAGFCSAALLPVEGKGDVLHLGLTCVRPDNRSGGLTHTLTSRVLVQYLVRYRPFSKVWVSNVACVLSSLGNVALHFEEIYPAPSAPARPSVDHVEIAQAIDYYYRDKIYIASDSRFDAEKFVFRGSVKETVFQKSDDDQQFFHRDRELNEYYQNLMSFDNGDEVLQVGYVTLLTYVKYAAKKLMPKEKRGQRRDRGYPSGAEPNQAA